MFSSLNQKKTLICFAASPMHLISIGEFIKEKNIEKYSIIVFKQPLLPKATQQLYEVIDFYSLTNISFMDVPRGNLRYLKELKFVIKLSFIYRQFHKTFIIFHIRSTFCQFLRRVFQSSEFVLIDDGFASYLAIKNYILNGEFIDHSMFEGWRGKVKKIMYFQNSYSKIRKREYAVYTIYADYFNLVNVNKNNLNFLRKSIEKKDQDSDKNIVYFLGTRTSERGLMPLSLEIKTIKKLKNFFEKSNKRFVYVKKRSTSELKYQLIRNEGIDVVEFNRPIELELFRHKILPGSIVMNESTAIATISMIFPKIDLYYFRLPYTNLQVYDKLVIDYFKEILKNRNISKVNFLKL